MELLTKEHIINIVACMADTIIENEVYFCELDSVAGDGDFGMSLAKGFRAVKQEWDNLDSTDIGTYLRACGMIITEYCGGASGPIWGSAFMSAARNAKGKTELSLSELAGMMESAVEGIQKRGGAQLGDKTLLDALIPAVVSLNKDSCTGKSVEIAFKNAATAAEEGAEKTKEMVAKKGRATYVGERSVNYPDAGAMALGIIFKRIAQMFL
jgi:dihydroxyacetone kinase